MSKKLVAYFSATGNTAKVAKVLAGKTEADLFEILPEKPYSKADLDWRDDHSRTSIEMKGAKSRPAIKASANVAAYDVIFLGFPIWWYREPTIVDTFLESADFSGKKLVLFATAGSSSFGNTAKNVKALLPASAEVKEGKVFYNVSYAREIEKWVETLAL